MISLGSKHVLSLVDLILVVVFGDACTDRVFGLAVDHLGQFSHFQFHVCVQQTVELIVIHYWNLVALVFYVIFVPISDILALFECLHKALLVSLLDGLGFEQLRLHLGEDLHCGVLKVLAGEGLLHVERVDPEPVVNALAPYLGEFQFANVAGVHQLSV